MPKINPYAPSRVLAPKPHVEPRPERLAINLFDLDRLEPIVRQMLLAGKLDLNKALRIGKEDETAVAFSCDLLAAACLCDVIRSNDRKLGDFETRIYLLQEEGRTWVKLPFEAVLAEVIFGDGQEETILNPSIFPPLEVAEEIPLTPTKAI